MLVQMILIHVSSRSHELFWADSIEKIESSGLPALVLDGVSCRLDQKGSMAPMVVNAPVAYHSDICSDICCTSRAPIHGYQEPRSYPFCTDEGIEARGGLRE